MLVDGRLRAGGLGELARLLGDALPDYESVRACAERLEVRTGEAIRGSTLDEKWQSLVEAADDDPEIGVQALLADVLGALPPNGNKAAALRAWSARGARTLSVGQAIEECAGLMRQITSFADPRDASVQVQALAGALRDIVEAAQEVAAGPPPSYEAAGSGTADDIAAAARRAAAAVRHVQAGLALVPAALTRIGTTASAAAAFEANLAIVGQLLDATTAAEQQVAVLLQRLRRAHPLR